MWICEMWKSVCYAKVTRKINSCKLTWHQRFLRVWQICMNTMAVRISTFWKNQVLRFSLWFLEYKDVCCFLWRRALVEYIAWKTWLRVHAQLNCWPQPCSVCVLHVQPCVTKSTVIISCQGYGHKTSTALLMSVAARCGLRAIGVRGPGPAAVAKVNTNMQPPPIDQLIHNLTSSCRCLLNDL